MESMTTPKRRKTTAKRAVSRPTARRTAPAPAPPAESFYRDLVWNLRNGILAVTQDGRIAVINDVAYRIFGLTPRPTDIGRSYADVLKDLPDVTRIVAGAFELSHLPNRAELRVKRTNKVIGYTLSQVRDRRGRITGATLFFKDLTRVEQLEERERLRDRLAALGQMAAAIAHEVKNPLAGIEVMAGLLRRRLLESPDAQAVLTDIIKDAKMAAAIVQEVLEFVRPIRLQVEHTSIASAVHGALQLADTRERQGAIEVDVDLPGELPEIQGDPDQLTQVFTNLLINAFEAMEGRGTVRITATSVRLANAGDGRDAVLVEVFDDGPGIPPDVAENVFDPFFTTKPKGSGLGLSIVRKIVDAHDGRIDVQTAPGQGTTIRVTLPVTGSDDEG
jgi:PAS domain S-box-containing protein